MDVALELLDIRPVCQSQLDNFDIVLTTWIHVIHILLQLAESEEDLCQIFHEVCPMLKQNIKMHKTGDSLLHLAVSSSSTLHSNSFLDGDNESSTSLAVFPSAPVTDFILQCGFDVHVRNNINETPLHLAVKARVYKKQSNL